MKQPNAIVQVCQLLLNLSKGSLQQSTAQNLQLLKSQLLRPRLKKFALPPLLRHLRQLSQSSSKRRYLSHQLSTLRFPSWPLLLLSLRWPLHRFPPPQPLPMAQCLHHSADPPAVVHYQQASHQSAATSSPRLHYYLPHPSAHTLWPRRSFQPSRSRHIPISNSPNLYNSPFHHIRLSLSSRAPSPCHQATTSCRSHLQSPRP